MNVLFKKVQDIDPNAIFVISKNLNSNVVVYSKTEDEQTPLNVYWVVYEDDPSGSELEALTLIEYNLAYGYTVYDSNYNGKGNTVVTINSMPSLKIQIFDNKCYIVRKDNDCETIVRKDNDCETIVRKDNDISNLVEITSAHLMCTNVFGAYPRVDKLMLFNKDILVREVTE